MRTPDTLDYLLICAMSVLAYFQLPWRPQIRRALRSIASVLTSLEPSHEAIIITLAAVGGVSLFLLVGVLPARQGQQ